MVDPTEEVLLPILIIPGVASSGLIIEKSSLDKKYEGRRLWVNPGFLAEARLLAKKAFNEDEIKCMDDVRERDRVNMNVLQKTEDVNAMKNAWISHICLDNNMMDEIAGNRVRPYEGIKGCDYLSDGVGKLPAIVMGNLVEYCVNIGYEREKNIDAMPYDWRLAPSINEKRDGYLTKIIERIERMYKENDNLPIVLFCHSMGAKMGHYFLSFAKKYRGQEWLDKYVHTYMPIGAPHGGVGCAVRTGLTGKGLSATVDFLVGNEIDGIMMYRSWSCGNWLMPRMLPKGMFPTCILRREGELGVTLTSEIEVGTLFANRDKPPHELRLTVIFRNQIYANSEFHPIICNKTGKNPKSMMVSFDETFYIAVPDLGKDDDLGELLFYLEEPAGSVNQNKSKLGKTIKKYTQCIRVIKKKFSACFRSIAINLGTAFRVAACDQPLHLRVSDFIGDNSKAQTNGKHVLDKTITIINLGEKSGKESIGTLSLKLSYSTPPKSTGTKVSETPIAMINDDTPNPPIICMSEKPKDVPTDNRVVYDVMNGIDVFKADGFVDNMVDLVKNVYEEDPLGPTKESSLDAPPVNCVRAIYGINIDTEVGGVYRKVPVVTIGDNLADHRFTLDTSASFGSGDDAWAKENLLTYKINDGIVYETQDTLQDIPGKTEQRRVCGDGTVPYWNMVVPLSWKDKIETLTVDELPGASHRAVVYDERLFALVKKYCTVVDPR